MLQNYFLALLCIATSAVLQSCSTCDPGTSLYVRGTVGVRVNQSGVLETAEDTGPKYSLRDPGESFVVVEDAPFVLDVPDAVDLSSYALVVTELDTVVPGGKLFRVALRESCQPYIEMDKSCKMVNWYNPYRLPEVRIRNTDEQLVMTPLLGPTNELVGYEVRLGDHTNCGSPALDRLRAYRRTSKQPIAGIRPIRSSTRKAPTSLKDLIIARPKS